MIVLIIFPDTMKIENFTNFIFLTPAEIKIKSPITGIHAAKNIALHPNLSNNLLCFFSCFSRSDFFLIFLINLFPPNPRNNLKSLQLLIL